jgi:hypothetical protein
MLMAMLGLLVGLWAGLVRLGWGWPIPQATWPMHHGPLMIGGFLGTLIGLERAVAIEHRWAWAAPLASGLGCLALLAGVPGWPAPALITLGSLVLIAVVIAIARLQPALFTVTIAVGGGAWAIGNLLWLAGRPLADAVIWWAGFLVLTIAGERLELSRVLRLSRAAFLAFLLAVGILGAGLIVSTVDLTTGVRLAGLGMLVLTAWLLRFDLARRTARRGAGQARFIAVCLLAGYFWLGIGGLLALAYNGAIAGPFYDALLHAIFVGFVLSMIYGHALIIFPAILQITIPYRPRFYAHLALLHLSLVLRIAGDLGGWLDGRRWGGLLNEVAIVLFLASTVWAVVEQRRGRAFGR